MAAKFGKIKGRLLFGLSFVVLCASFAAAYAAYHNYAQDLKQGQSDRINQIITQIAINLDDYLDELYRLAVSPYYSAEIIGELSAVSNESAMAKLEKRRKIEDFLKMMMIVPRKDISTVFVITDETYYASRLPRTTLNAQVDPREQDWYAEATNKKSAIITAPGFETLFSGSADKILSVVQPLRSIYNANSFLGVIKVDANFSKITQICEKAPMNGFLLIFDNEGNAIYSSTPKPSAEVEAAIASIGGDVPFEYDMPGGTYLMNGVSTQNGGWRVIALNAQDAIAADAQKMLTRSLAVAFLCASAIIFGIFFAMKNAVKAKELADMRLLQKSATLTALSNQIKPHFLNNTLNLVSMQVQCGKTEPAVDNINALSRLLRRMTQLDANIKLSEEIDLLNAYLSIQSSRFAGKLTYSVDIDERFRDLIVPALILQPLVENSVIHGCEPKEGLTMIRVTCFEEDGRLVFEVMDDGAGMDAETLTALQRRLENADAEPPGGVGAVNAHNRARLMFGAGYGLTIESEPSVKTVARLTIPLGGIGRV